MDDRVNLADKIGLLGDVYSPRIVGYLNDYKLVVVKVLGEFVWHRHEETDDFFLVLEGQLTIQLRDRNIELKAVSGAGLRVLAEAERTDERVAGQKKHTRGHRKHAALAGLIRTELLPQREQDRAAFVRRQLSALAEAGQKATKEIAGSFKPPDALPRSRPTEE